MSDERDRTWDAGGPRGSTALGPDEVEGLIPTWIATRAELNEAEQQNILDGLGRRRWQNPSTEELLDDLTARSLHKDMFGNVWTWAGRYRITERNIGVDPRTIAVCLRDLMEDAKLWIAGTKPRSVDQAGAAFHHRLVQIHPFPNGNGRHSRAMTDMLLRSVGAEPFTWGRVSLTSLSATRASYFAGLRAADDGDIAALAAFVRT
jgi:Fic-DOC domain mobile mystery protein B